MYSKNRWNTKHLTATSKWFGYLKACFPFYLSSFKVISILILKCPQYWHKLRPAQIVEISVSTSQEFLIFLIISPQPSGILRLKGRGSACLSVEYDWMLPDKCFFHIWSVKLARPNIKSKEICWPGLNQAQKFLFLQICSLIQFYLKTFAHFIFFLQQLHHHFYFTTEKFRTFPCVSVSSLNLTYS